MSSQDQRAPLILPGAGAQAATTTQFVVPNQWQSGDRVLLQLRGADGLNCSSAPRSLGFGADVEVEIAGPFLLNTVTGDAPATRSPWTLNTRIGGPFAANNGNVADRALVDGPADLPVALPGGTAPTLFGNKAHLHGSIGCASNQVNDVIEVRFNNESTALADNPDTPIDESIAANVVWQITVKGITIDAGSQVTPGPVRLLPIAQNARPNLSEWVNAPNMFSGNVTPFGADNTITSLVQNEWTNPAYVLPFKVEATTPASLVADGFPQNLGTLTLTETYPAAFTNAAADPFQLCYGPGISDVRGALLQVAPMTPPSAYSATATSSGACVNIQLTGTFSNAAIESITVSNIFADVNTAGSKVVTVTQAPAAIDAFLQPSDQAAPGLGVYTDVNVGDLFTLMFPVAVASALPDRIGGSDRYETAAKIAFTLADENALLGIADCADFAVLVNGNSFADSLSASYLAGAIATSNLSSLIPGGLLGREVPVLTTPRDSLSPHVKLALAELGIRSVYIVGGNSAVSAAVAAEVASLPRTICGGIPLPGGTGQTVQVQRIQGADRYETNQRVVQAAQSILLQWSDPTTYNNRLRYQSQIGEASQRTALLASGADFADALAAGPHAYGDDEYGFPLILTGGASLSPTAAETIANLDIEQVVVIGGPAAVSTNVTDALESLGVDVIRVAGANRYQTAAAVLLWAGTPEFPGPATPVDPALGFQLGLGNPIGGNIFLARGDNFADALAGAPLVAAWGGNLVLTTPTALHADAAAYLAVAQSNPFTDPDFVIAFGLGNAISTSVLTAANAIVNP